MTFTSIVYGPFRGRSVISSEECTNKFRKSLKVEVLLKIWIIHWARKLRTSDLVLWKLLLVRYCFVMWVLFSVFSIFFVTSLIYLMVIAPRNFQINGQIHTCNFILSIFVSLPSWGTQKMLARVWERWRVREEMGWGPLPLPFFVDFVLFSVYLCSSGPRGNRYKSDNKQTTYNTFHHNL